MGKLQHYIVVALRSFRKNKVSFALSFLGLTVAFSLCLISGFMVWNLYNSDGHWDKADRIYQLTLEEKSSDSIMNYYIFPEGLVEDLKDFSDGFESLAPIVRENGDRITNNKRYQIMGSAVDNAFLDIFDFEPLHGDLKAVLETENIVAIPDDKGIEIFGKANALGETLEIHAWYGETIQSYTVGAVYKHLPEQSVLRHTQFFTKRLATREREEITHAYVLMKEGADIEAIGKQINDFAYGKYPLPKYADNAKYVIKPIKGAQLNWLSSHFMKSKLYGLAGSSLFMLFIAILNFISLSTAMAATRGKDVALRKIMGASRKELASQYLIESLILVTLAYCCSLALAEIIALPVEDLTGGKYTGITWERLPHLLIGLGLALLIGIITSVYPVWVLVHGQAATLLQNFQRGVAHGGTRLRSILLTLQAMCGLGLVFAAGVIYQQATFQETIDKGFDDKNLIYLTFAIHMQGKYPSARPFINEIMPLGGIETVGRNSWSLPFKNFLGEYSIAHPITSAAVKVGFTSYGEGFFQSLGVPIIAGRLPTPPVDSGSLNDIVHGEENVVNQSFIKHFNLGSPDEVIGKCIYRLTGEEQKRGECQEIHAVVADFHFNADETPVVPTFFSPVLGYANVLILRLKEGTDTKSLIPQMQEIWDRHFPDRVFKYEFVDDLINEKFRTLRGMGIMLLITGFATLFLTVAGLYAMARFVVVRRRREIAIRRVVGASNIDIMQLVIYQLSKPVIAGAIIGIPIGWYYALDWLESYSVRITPEPWHAVLLGLIGISFFLISVTGEILRAVRIRPAEALHHE